MPPTFTTVGYTTTQFSEVVPGPCEALVVPTRIAYNPFCDEDGFYALQRLTTQTLVSPLPNGHCHLLHIWITETYHSHEKCADYKRPEDLGFDEEWWAYAEPDPLAWDVPPVQFPRQRRSPPKTTIDPTTGAQLTWCIDNVDVAYTLECIKSFIRVTRVVQVEICSPLPSGLCRVLEHVVSESYMTKEPCDPLDWVEAPPAFTAGIDAQRLWQESMIAGLKPEEKAEEGTMRVGREWDKRHPFRGVVREIQKQELVAFGAPPDHNTNRFVVIRSVNGLPASRKNLDAITKTEPVVFVVGIEGSDFTSAVKFRGFRSDAATKPSTTS